VALRPLRTRAKEPAALVGHLSPWAGRGHVRNWRRQDADCNRVGGARLDVPEGIQKIVHRRRGLGLCRRRQRARHGSRPQRANERSAVHARLNLAVAFFLHSRPSSFFDPTPRAHNMSMFWRMFSFSDRNVLRKSNFIAVIRAANTLKSALPQRAADKGKALGARSRKPPASAILPDQGRRPGIQQDCRWPDYCFQDRLFQATGALSPFWPVAPASGRSHTGSDTLARLNEVYR
jgi:hypothetical protein